jgi:hypothetical protein
MFAESTLGGVWLSSLDMIQYLYPGDKLNGFYLQSLAIQKYFYYILTNAIPVSLMIVAVKRV